MTGEVLGTGRGADGMNQKAKAGKEQMMEGTMEKWMVEEPRRQAG